MTEVELLRTDLSGREEKRVGGRGGLTRGNGQKRIKQHFCLLCTRSGKKWLPACGMGSQDDRNNNCYDSFSSYHVYS